MKVAVVGAGAWGTTLATIISSEPRRGCGRRETDGRRLDLRRRVNPFFLDGFAVPAGRAGHGCPRRGARGGGRRRRRRPGPARERRHRASRCSRRPDATILIATKGIELSTRLRMSEVLAEVLPGHDPGAIGCVSGRTWLAR